MAESGATVSGDDIMRVIVNELGRLLPLKQQTRSWGTTNLEITFQDGLPTLLRVTDERKHKF